MAKGAGPGRAPSRLRIGRQSSQPAGSLMRPPRYSGGMTAELAPWRDDTAAGAGQA